MGIGYIPSKQDSKHMSWCIDNDIKIYPKPVERGLQNKLYYICIDINGKQNCDFKKTYSNLEYSEVIYQYYKYYYDKYKK